MLLKAIDAELKTLKAIVPGWVVVMEDHLPMGWVTLYADDGCAVGPAWEVLFSLRGIDEQSTDQEIREAVEELRQSFGNGESWTLQTWPADCFLKYASKGAAHLIGLRRNDGESWALVRMRSGDRQMGLDPLEVAFEVDVWYPTLSLMLLKLAPKWVEQCRKLAAEWIGS